jgi:glycosyltransferase involved in cell wall biosynthesis
MHYDARRRTAVMTERKPTVSVLMASYNYAQYVAEAIRSVWAQTYPDLELIVIDDGSTDESPQIIEELCEKSPVWMEFRRQDNAGPSAAVNHALSLASGEWVCLLACDDYYSPDFIERNLDQASSHRDRDIVIHSNGYLIEVDGKITGTLAGVSPLEPLKGHAFEAFATGHGRILPSTMFVRRNLLLKIGGFDPEIIAEDCDLMLRLARAAEFDYIEDPIFYSRYTPGSLGKKPWLWGDGIIKALAKHEDLLGKRLPGLLAQASANICDHCFEYGEWSHGIRWGGKALGYAPGLGAKGRLAGHLTYRIARAGVRNVAYRLFGRERLVRLKRKLQRT